MQTFRSVCKLTPEIISEYHKSTGKLLDVVLMLLIELPFAIIMAIVLRPYYDSPTIFTGRHRYTLPFALLCLVGAGFYKYVLPHIHRIFLRSALRDNEKRFRTASPTLESRIEDNAIITRCHETSSEERTIIHGCTVVRTQKHLFIRLSRSHLAIFTISDFSDEVLDDLLSTLAEYGAEILPK